MKVVQINNNHQIVGGSDTVYLNTGTMLSERGHEVSYFAGKGAGDLPCEDTAYFPDSLTTATSRISDLPRYFHNRAARSAMRALIDAKGPFDIAHLHIYYGRLTASIFKPLKERGIPIVQSLHEYKLACPVYTLERGGAICEDCIQGSTLNCLRQRCKGGSLIKSAVVLAEYHASRLQGDVRLIDRFICVSDFQRQILGRAGIPEKKMTTLHNFVDPALLAPIGPTQQKNYMLYFGRIEKLKGISTLVEAAIKSGTHLRIAGTGAWSETLEALIANTPYIEYLGFVSGAPLRKLVAEARAVVVPSEWYENCPMTVLEAKAVGTPVIGARIGGIPELIRDGVDGYLFESGDTSGLAKVFETLKTTNLASFRTAARADVMARFSPNIYYTSLLQVYNDIRQRRT
jgi:glycosyltransferase involved in cell wall biosynthesis